MSEAQSAEWEVLRAAHPDYATPLMSPAFARAAATDRPDAEVCFIRDASGLLAVMAYYRRPDGFGRPIGAPFCDYAGPVVRQGCGLSLEAIVRLCGLTAWRSTAMLDPWDAFTLERTDPDATLVIRLGEMAPADYLEARRTEHPKRFKNFRRLDNQMHREGHTLTFRWGALDEATKTELYAFKSAQYRASGLVDLISATRSRAILDAISSSSGGFHTSLWSGDAFVSAHFGFRQGEAFHPWVAAYNPALAHFSPGNLLLKRIIEAMPEMALTEYDLAEGHDHYKKYYTDARRNIYSASVTIGPAQRLGKTIWTLAGATREGSPVQRLRRRIDHAAASEARLSARIADIRNALVKRGVNAPAEVHAAGRQAD